MTVEERIYSTLTGSAELTALLANGADSIYKGKSDDAGTYPVVVITLVSAVPAMHGDDTLLAYRTVHRISAISENGAVKDLRRAIYRAMTDAGFLWQNTAELHDEDSYVLSMDFEYCDEV